MGIISAISAWGVLSFLRAGMKKQRTNNTITKTEISKSIIETYPFTQIDKNHKENGIDEKDNWEQFDFYRAIVRKAKGNYLITYTDQCGLTTERNISIKRVYDKDSKFALDVHCHLHNVHRSFINDGIQKAVDTETGEVIENVAQHTIAQYENSREGKVWSALGCEVDLLDILLFICRADGRMLKAESEIIADHLKRRCSDLIFEERA